MVPDNEFRPISAYHFPKVYEEQVAAFGVKRSNKSKLYKLDDEGFTSYPYSLAAHRAFLRTPMTSDVERMSTSTLILVMSEAPQFAGRLGEAFPFRPPRISGSRDSI